MKQKELIAYIREQADDAGLDGDLCIAIAMQESSLAYPRANVRFEPQIVKFDQPDYYAKINGISIPTERTLQATSFGPMHVLGRTARALGYAGPLERLSDVALGVEYGLKMLIQLHERYDSEDSVIAAYNWGSAKKINGRYSNQVYVDSVKDRLIKLRSIG